MIGNESGPICLGASLKKEVHSIYLPKHTKPESQIINKEIKYYNIDLLTDEKITNKILRSVMNKNWFGGETGIRTLGTFNSTHTFQACALNRSAISPATGLY